MKTEPDLTSGNRPHIAYRESLDEESRQVAGGTTGETGRPHTDGEQAATVSEISDSWEAVEAHHRLSSLDPDKPGALPEKLSRRLQPIPFRRFPGAPKIVLPLPLEELSKVRAQESVPWARLLGSSLALTGWKRVANAAFGLRAVPSAGNLHPTESYVLAAELDGPEPSDSPEVSAAAVYHYSPFDHALERRRGLSTEAWTSLRSGSPRALAFLGLSSVSWRCAWKYGERSFRLCHLDAGHAVAALDAAAALEGLRVRWVDTDDGAIEALLGLGSAAETERERAVCLLALEPRRRPAESAEPSRWRPSATVLEELHTGQPSGKASPASEGDPEAYRHWPGLERAWRATRRGPGDDAPQVSSEDSAPGAEQTPWPRQHLLARRSRSRLGGDPLPADVFGALLRRLTGGAGGLPANGDLASLVLVHAVEGLEPGLYAATDQATPVEELRRGLRTDLEWRSVSEAWPGLLRLSRGNARRAATFLAGHQDAAGSGAFTALWLGRRGPTAEGFDYRALHWRAGALGHALYLEAEVHGLGATGLAGFFDDRLCDLLGIRDRAWMPLYLLAVGQRQQDDPQLEPPYAHRSRNVCPVPPSRGGWRPPGSS